jgi:hypothetical protein
VLGRGTSVLHHALWFITYHALALYRPHISCGKATYLLNRRGLQQMLLFRDLLAVHAPYLKHIRAGGGGCTSHCAVHQTECVCCICPVYVYCMLREGQPIKGTSLEADTKERHPRVAHLGLLYGEFPLIRRHSYSDTPPSQNSRP